MQKTEQKQEIEIDVLSRLPRKEHKKYYLYWLRNYAQLFNPDKIKRVQFGKQDIRGAHSITVVFHNSCCDGIRYFYTMQELVEYVVGFTSAMTKEQWIRKEYFK